MDATTFYETLEKNQIRVTAGQWMRLQHFEQLLRETNQKINLISRKGESQIWENHILHSLAVLPIQPLPQKGNICDLGTGGGFPGIPLAILHPELSFTLVDSKQKKIKAVQTMIDALGLQNAQAVASRAEDLQIMNRYKKRFQIITARAVAPLCDLEKFTRTIRLPNSKLLAFKGGFLDDEIKEVLKTKAVKSVKQKTIHLEGAPQFTIDEKKIVTVQFCQ